MPTLHEVTSTTEIKHILLADVVLTIAFSVSLSGGLFGGSNLLGSILYILPIAAVAVALSFVLHELMHKFVAQHYGAQAEFRTSQNGLLITLVTSAFGFLMAIPGATYIFAHNFTRRQNGIVSLAGPATNLVIFAFALLIGFHLFGPGFSPRNILNGASYTYLEYGVSFLVFISVYLAFFNMLPIMPLDGSKVLAWNALIYVPVMAGIMALLYLYTPISILDILLVVGIALMFSLFYRALL